MAMKYCVDKSLVYIKIKQFGLLYQMLYLHPAMFHKNIILFHYESQTDSHLICYGCKSI